MTSLDLLTNGDLSHSERILLQLLLSRCNPDRDEGHLFCWPSNKTLASEMTVSKSQVKRYLERLDAKGYIRRHLEHDENLDYDRRIIVVDQCVTAYRKQSDE